MRVVHSATGKGNENRTGKRSQAATHEDDPSTQECPGALIAARFLRSHEFLPEQALLSLPAGQGSASWSAKRKLAVGTISKQVQFANNAIAHGMPLLGSAGPGIASPGKGDCRIHQDAEATFKMDGMTGYGQAFGTTASSQADKAASQQETASLPNEMASAHLRRMGVASLAGSSRNVLSMSSARVSASRMNGKIWAIILPFPRPSNGRPRQFSVCVRDGPGALGAEPDSRQQPQSTRGQNVRPQGFADEESISILRPRATAHVIATSTPCVDGVDAPLPLALATHGRGFRKHVSTPRHAVSCILAIREGLEPSTC